MSFNINLRHSDKNKIVKSFLNTMFRFGMIPTINKSTRVTRHTATTLEHVFSNTINDNIKIQTAIVKTYIQSFSYHFCYKKSRCRDFSAIHF